MKIPTKKKAQYEPSPKMSLPTQWDFSIQRKHFSKQKEYFRRSNTTVSKIQRHKVISHASISVWNYDT